MAAEDAAIPMSQLLNLRRDMINYMFMDNIFMSDQFSDAPRELPAF